MIILRQPKLRLMEIKMLKEAEDPLLRGRKLSIVVLTIIAVALSRNLPMLSGDKNLMYAAKKYGIKIIW